MTNYFDLGSQIQRFDLENLLDVAFHVKKLVTNLLKFQCIEAIFMVLQLLMGTLS
jgi:hypothetical protein